MSDRLRVLLVSGSAPPIQCGVGDYAARLCRALVDIGVDARLLTSRWPERTGKEAGLEGVDRVEPVGDWRLQGFFAARRAIKAFDPDLLHIQWPAQKYDGFLFAALAQWFRHLVRRPVVLTLHEHIPPDLHAPQMAARAADMILSVRPNFPEGYAQGLSAGAASKPFRHVPSTSNLPTVTPTSAEAQALRARFGIAPGARIIAYFGLIYPERGIEQLFDIADPARDHLLIIGGQLENTDDYFRRIGALCDSERWRGRATRAGYLTDHEAALALACADAVVLPFLKGGGIWNTSILAARFQGTFLLTTSITERGYDAERNIYNAEPGNVVEMRAALTRHLGQRQPGSADLPRWPDVARLHREIYTQLVAGPTLVQGSKS